MSCYCLCFVILLCVVINYCNVLEVHTAPLFRSDWLYFLRVVHVKHFLPLSYFIIIKFSRLEDGGRTYLQSIRTFDHYTQQKPHGNHENLKMYLYVSDGALLSNAYLCLISICLLHLAVSFAFMLPVMMSSFIVFFPCLDFIIHLSLAVMLNILNTSEARFLFYISMGLIQSEFIEKYEDVT